VIIHQKGISIAQKQIASKPLTLERLFPIAVKSPILIGIAKISSPAKSMKKQFVLLQAYHQPRQILNVFSTLPADIGVLKIKAIMFVM